MKNLKITLWLTIILCQLSWSQDSTWTEVQLDSNQTIVISQIEYDIKNAFDDVQKHTDAENWLYRQGNNLRFKTRQSVINDNLLFEQGDEINLKTLEESERLLRNQIYLADAKITLLKNTQTNQYKAHVQSSDKWTTNVPLALSKESEWLYSVGLVEYNTLGFGHQVGLFYSKQLERDLWYTFLGYNHFLFKRNKLDLTYSNLSDGYDYGLKMSRPLLESVDRFSYHVNVNQSVKTKYKYLNRNTTQNWLNLEDSTYVNDIELSHDKGEPVFQYRRVKNDSINVDFRVLLSKKQQLELLGGYKYIAQTHESKKSDFLFKELDSNRYIYDPMNVNPLWTRVNSMPYLGFKLKSTHYKTVKNFRKVKWSEDIEVGPWALAVFYMNLESLGARDNEVKFKQGLGFSDYWFESWYTKFQGLNEFYLNENNVIDGYSYFSFESQIRQSGQFTTVLNSELKSFYNSTTKREMTLGGFEGLTGFPDFYYSDASTFWFQLEQRWFPKLELGTAMPVVALFLNGGQSASKWEEIPMDDLHYRAGLGLRIGLTKSTLGIVNHLNVSWPINGPFEKSYLPTFSIIAKTSL